MSRKLALIPARGGSKRIPRKNIKDFLGKPIIAYAIETALNSNLFDEVMVSTDDEEIAKIAKEFGAKVPFLRSKERANDFASTFDVIEEVLISYKSIGIEFDYCCCIYPCTPLLTSEIFSNAFSTLKKGNYDSVFPVIEYGHPIQRSLSFQKGNIIMNHSEHLLTRSQDLKKNYHDAGQFYWLSLSNIIKSKKLFTNNSTALVIDELRAQDIDTLSDWHLAEMKFKLLSK